MNQNIYIFWLMLCYQNMLKTDRFYKGINNIFEDSFFWVRIVEIHANIK